MELSDVVCEIKWTVEDIREAFVRKYGRYPTEGQLRDCVANVRDSALEDRSIECGWEVIQEELI